MAEQRRALRDWAESLKGEVADNAALSFMTLNVKVMHTFASS